MTTSTRSLITVACLIPLATALLSTQKAQPPLVRQQEKLQHRSASSLAISSQDEPDCDPCAFYNNDEDIELDRREAFFSMLGMAWAAGALPEALLTGPEPAIAIYGTDAKIELPNPIQSMSDRATKQCLVESLGTRECLVYMDPDDKLYQGADGKLLLERVDAASKSLSLVPSLIESKKWSQVTGVLTGPMGELIRTMNQLVEISDNKAVAKGKVGQIKTDLYAIAAAVDRKNIEGALKAHQAATDHLVDFVKVL